MPLRLACDCVCNLLAEERSELEQVVAGHDGHAGATVEYERVLVIARQDREEANDLVERQPGMTVVAGHNLFKLAPLLGEDLADAAERP